MEAIAITGHWNDAPASQFVVTRNRRSRTQEFFPRVAIDAGWCMRQTGATKNAFAIAVMLHLRAPYDSKTAILGCWVVHSGQKSKSRLNSKDLDRLASCLTPFSSDGLFLGHSTARRDFCGS
ncbi:MAG: hypothetical protein ACRCV5_18865 [Afipia sp.]